MRETLTLVFVEKATEMFPDMGDYERDHVIGTARHAAESALRAHFARKSILIAEE